MINFPIVFCLFFFFKSITAKVKPKLFRLSATFLIIATITIITNSWLIGHSGRYTIDFAFFIIFVSIFGAYNWCNGEASCAVQTKNRLKTAYTLLTMSIFVGLMLFVYSTTNDTVPGNVALYRYLQYSLGLIGSA
jgi:hypothetical protein